MEQPQEKERSNRDQLFRAVDKGRVNSGPPTVAEDSTLRQRAKAIQQQAVLPPGTKLMVTLPEEDLLALRTTAAVGMVGWTILGMMAGFFGMKWLKSNVTLPWAAKKVVEAAV